MKTVDAISKSDCDLVHALLLKRFNVIYADTWKIGINLSLRIGDLLSLKFLDIDLKNNNIKLVESKTGKFKQIRINSAANIVIAQRLANNPTDVYLFQVNSNRAKNAPISRVSVSRVFKTVGNSLGLSINTHSMRKSRGMAMYNDGVPIEKIAMVLNHSNTASTLRYIGVTKEQVLSTFDDYIL